jgi:hypothetical protein
LTPWHTKYKISTNREDKGEGASSPATFTD